MLRQDLRQFPRGAWVLFGGSFINRFGSFISVFLVLYLTDSGYSAPEAGAAVGAYGIGSAAATGVGGFLADRIGRRETIAISMFSSAAAMLALSQARGLVTIGVLVAVAGLAAELYRPASGALLADLLPPGLRVTGFAAYRLAINAGFAFGPAVAGFLASRSFFLLFVGDAVTSVAYGLLALRMLPAGRGPAQDSPTRAALSRIARDRTFLTFCLSTLLGAICYMQIQSTLSLHVVDSGHTAATYGLLISFNGVLIVLLELGLTNYTKRVRARRAMTLGMLLTGVGFALTSIAHSLPLLAFTVVLWTLGEIIHAPVSQAFVTRLAPPDMRGRYLGVYGLSFAAALVIAPSAGGWIYSRDPTLLWLICGALSSASAALIFFGRDREVTPRLGPEAGPEIAGLES